MTLGLLHPHGLRCPRKTLLGHGHTVRSLCLSSACLSCRRVVLQLVYSPQEMPRLGRQIRVPALRSYNSSEVKDSANRRGISWGEYTSCRTRSEEHTSELQS